MNVRLVRMSDNARLPEKGSLGAAGFDLFAAEPVSLAPGARAMVDTGWNIAVPTGYEAQVRPRSGNAIKKGLTVINSPGTIDEDYRGPLKVLLVNLGKETVNIDVGCKMAQMVVAAVPQMSVEEVVAFEDTTERGEGGFGSTGD